MSEYMYKSPSTIEIIDGRAQNFALTVLYYSDTVLYLSMSTIILKSSNAKITKLKITVCKNIFFIKV